MSMPKYRRTSFAQELAKVPVADVARIAATLLKDGGADAANPSDAVHRAYELLEIACHAHLALGLEQSYEAGIAGHQDALASWEGLQRGMAAALHYDFEKDAAGQARPVAFDQALAVLMPKPGVRASQTKDERTARFRAFIRARQWVGDAKKSEQELIVDAGELVERWKKTGIPAKEFAKMLAIFPTWWQHHISTERSEAGRSGAKARKGKR